MIKAEIESVTYIMTNIIKAITRAIENKEKEVLIFKDAKITIEPLDENE